MTSRQKARLVLFAALGALLLAALGNALGLWASDTSTVSPKGYVAISHGSHTHYVPNGWTGEPSISDFPTSPPPDGMTVGPTGQIIPAP